MVGRVETSPIQRRQTVGKESFCKDKMRGSFFSRFVEVRRSTVCVSSEIQCRKREEGRRSWHIFFA